MWLKYRPFLFIVFILPEMVFKAVWFFILVQLCRAQQKYCDNNCLTGDGYFCVKDNPGSFSVCLNSQRIAVKQCSSGLVYDITQKACNWPSEIKGEQCPCQPPTTRAPTTRGPTTPSTPRTGPPPLTRPPAPSGLKRVCYFTNWAVYRKDLASYTVSQVDPFLCTHLIVAFMKLQNAEISYLEEADPKTLTALTKLRNEKNPALKILVAIGGWNAGSSPFMDLLANDDTMYDFINQAIQFLRQNDLDGLDIDWEYPQGMVGPYSKWMLAMRSAFENEARSSGLNRLLLTAAVSAGQSTIDWAYDVPKLSEACDFINLMSYDLNGPWSASTGLNSGLDSNDQLNVGFAADYWVRKGAEASELIVGVPLYGRKIKLCNSSQTGIGSKACGGGEAGPFTGESGFEAYYESCLKIQCSKQRWSIAWDSKGQAPYMSLGNQWISYENQQSIEAKVKFIKSKGYGGFMVWALDLDDFNDICGYGVKYPLMRTLVAASTNQAIPNLSSSPKPKVNPCDPTASGGGGGDGGGDDNGGSSDLDLCDNKCAVDGLYCLPNSPSKYYQCSNGQRSAPQTCHTGLQFSYVLKNCDWPANYPGCNCKLSTVKPSQPTTSTVTEKVTERPTTGKMTTTSSISTRTTAAISESSTQQTWSSWLPTTKPSD